MTEPTRARTVSLGGGVRVPYPEPLNAAATRIGRANRRSGTAIEVRLRSALHRLGLRFRKDHLVHCSNGVRVHPDIVFTRAKVVVFVDGCYWHRCPEHATTPKRNLEYWLPKLQANVDRDRRVDEALHQDGWNVVRTWEHEEIPMSAGRIVEVLGAATLRHQEPEVK
jgi:DNA mismatch endonuclease, patch repair protein